MLATQAHAQRAHWSTPANPQLTESTPERGKRGAATESTDSSASHQWKAFSFDRSSLVDPPAPADQKRTASTRSTVRDSAAPDDRKRAVSKRSTLIDPAAPADRKRAAAIPLTGSRPFSPADMAVSDEPETVTTEPATKKTWRERHWKETQKPDKELSWKPLDTHTIVQPHRLIQAASDGRLTELPNDSNQPLDHAKKVISGQVRVWDSTNLDKIVERLVDEHIARTPEAQKLDQQVKHYRTLKMRAVAKARDSLNFSTGYQGINPSKRMGQLVLTDKAKVRDATTAEYERQRYVDKIHSQVVACMMEIAMGMGTPEKDRHDQIIYSGVTSLDKLVGEPQSRAAFMALKTWLAKKQVPESAMKAPPWTTMEREQKLQTIIYHALQKDPVVQEIKVRVGKYANVSKVKCLAMSSINSSMNSAVMMAPGFALPVAAELTLNGIVMATGGSEDAKIEKTLVYDKRIQSRLKVLNQEATLALDNYRFAMVTKNAPLLAFSQALVSEMTTDEVASSVLPCGVDKAAPKVVPDIKTSKVEDENDS